MSDVPSMCFFCEHNRYSRKEILKGVDREFDWDKTKESCDTYPNGIPEAVFRAGHRFPKPNDHGVQFRGNLPFTDSRSQEQEDAAYEHALEYIDRDNEYEAKYGRKRPTVRIL